MLNIAICDDDVEMTGYLEELLYKNVKDSLIEIDVEIFFDGLELVKSIQNGKRFDLIYLEMEMGEKNGILIAKEIRKSDSNVFIVYVTESEKYVMESFYIRPFRYLLKPVNEKAFIDCFSDFTIEMKKRDYYFRYQYQRINYKILISDILYFES